MTTAHRPLWPNPKLTKVAGAVKSVLARGLMWAGQSARGDK